MARVDPLSFLERATTGDRADCLAHLERIAERPARAADLALAPELSVRLRRLGIDRLWSHQAEALEHLRAGRHVAVATGTASGKSLCYQLATFERLAADPAATALYLFPTKALSQDQLRQVRSFALPAARAAVFDGDTPSAERAWIRRDANVLITNYDMLHYGIMPAASRWTTFLKHLALVAVDELHTLRGIFGSHVACVLRRLRRLAAVHGARPVFAVASATIANPAELAGRLSGLDFESVDDDGSPRGPKYFALWNPPITDEGTGSRRSANAEAAALTTDLVSEGVRTIAFAKSRKGAELVAAYARDRLATSRPELAGRVAAYRAGYLPEERRALERALAEGELLAVAATTALELGIDIGGLDACVMAGFPGTIAATWQQAGRAGRRAGRSLAMLVAQEDPLDQFLVSHPDALFERTPEAALVDHANPNVLDRHLVCAAAEHALVAEDEEFFGPATRAALERLVAAGRLRARGARLYPRDRPSPAAEVDIRSAGGQVRIVDEATGALVGTVDEARAPSTVHPGAIYLHQTEQYRVSALDLGAGVALVRPSDEDVFTQSRDVTDIRVLSSDRKASLGRTEAFFGSVEVTTQVVAAVTKRLFTSEVLGVAPLDLPPMTLRTTAVWYTVPDHLLERAGLGPAEVPGSAHAAEHAAIGLLPLFAMCDRWDIGGVSTAMHPDTGQCTVFVYDGYPGGAGIAERGFAAAVAHQQATLEAIAGCRCEAGCPSCVQSPKCGNGNHPLDKAGAVRMLEAILS
jgi:DEAD/DEAH box helicase domain-containing protein